MSKFVKIPLDDGAITMGLSEESDVLFLAKVEREDSYVVIIGPNPQEVFANRRKGEDAGKEDEPANNCIVLFKKRKKELEGQDPDDLNYSRITASGTCKDEKGERWFIRGKDFALAFHYGACSFGETTLKVFKPLELA